jgi:hypothetical protein
MKNSNGINSIQVRLPLAVMVLIIAITTVLAVTNYRMASNEIEKEVEHESLESMVKDTQTLDKWLQQYSKIIISIQKWFLHDGNISLVWYNKLISV